MCQICNGMTPEEQVALVGRHVATDGFALMAVEAAVPWLYTIGLSRLSHPELVVGGVGPPHAQATLDALARRVLAGERFSAGSVIEHAGDALTFLEVHRSRLDTGLCAMWRQYDRVHPGSGPLRALQVRVPDDWFCACHRSAQPRFDLPGGYPGAPNREARRSKRR